MGAAPIASVQHVSFHIVAALTALLAGILVFRSTGPQVSS